MEIDIAVDMGGYTHDARPGVFSYRAAPVQVSFLGYPGTSGSEYMDYLIADEVVVPRQSQAYYSEKIVYMPDCYMPMDSKRVIDEHIFSRQELGLPPQGFVFCCFNNSYKINPTIFDVWVRVLKAIPGSVLWLREIHVQAAENLRQNAIERGLDPSRLVFAPMIEMPQHLARHRAADLFLDTLPFNAHTTASDALWAGLPVLTCPGHGFASRVAASMLNTSGLKELVTESLEHYEQKAIELAQQPQLLKALRDKLASAKHASALFDTASYTKHLEDAFCSMQKSSAKHHW
jgi:predicted O-linked N-acetylglucosamine transferase (SPINDLY family)